VTAHDDAMPDDLSDAEAFDLDADDFARAAVDLELHRRANARCVVSKPHRDADEDAPCSGCLLSAARQLAIARNLSTSALALLGPVSAGRTGSAYGAVGRVPDPRPARPAVPPFTNNRRERQLPAADSGPARPQNESMA
jgi:hypothetical protein